MKTGLFILVVFFIGENPETEGNALWAINGQENCETVAEIFSLNSEDGEGFICLEVKE